MDRVRLDVCCSRRDERERREVKGESKQTRQDANEKSRLQAEVAGRRRAAGDHVL